MTKKMTKKDYFNELKNIPAVAENEALMNFIDHEIDLLNRKNTSSTGEKKMTATQKENESIKEAIMETLKGSETGMTITEIMKACPICKEKEMSNQRVSSLVRQLKDDGVITKTEDKRKSYFSLA